MIVTSFDVETGHCLGSFEGRPLDLSAQSRVSSEILVAGAFNSDEHWLVDGQVAPRPKLVMRGKRRLVADDRDVARMSGIPEGTEVHVCFMDAPRASADRSVLSAVVDDGRFEWSTAIPGRFQITFVPPFPWQLLQFEVIADALS